MMWWCYGEKNNLRERKRKIKTKNQRCNEIKKKEEKAKRENLLTHTQNNSVTADLLTTN